MTMQKMVKVTTLTAEPFNKEWPPELISHFQVWLQVQLKNIPSEYRETARLEFETDRSVEETNSYITVSYIRLETPDEAQKREAYETRQRNYMKNQEVHQMRELMRKYPDAV